MPTLNGSPSPASCDCQDVLGFHSPPHQAFRAPKSAVEGAQRRPCALAPMWAAPWPITRTDRTPSFLSAVRPILAFGIRAPTRSGSDAPSERLSRKAEGDLPLPWLTLSVAECRRGEYSSLRYLVFGGMLLDGRRKVMGGFLGVGCDRAVACSPICNAPHRLSRSATVRVYRRNLRRCLVDTVSGFPACS